MYLLKILISLSLLLNSFACGELPPSNAESFLKGEHQLRKMVEKEELFGTMSGGFFLFMGGINGEMKSQTNVKFAWEMNDKTYAISSLPIERFRIKFDESITNLIIKFRWSRCNKNDLQQLMDQHVIYALVICKKGDWPVQIKLPLN
jgi:hypothetical protein